MWFGLVGVSVICAAARRPVATTQLCLVFPLADGGLLAARGTNGSQYADTAVSVASAASQDCDAFKQELCASKPDSCW